MAFPNDTPFILSSAAPAGEGLDAATILTGQGGLVASIGSGVTIVSTQDPLNSIAALPGNSSPSGIICYKSSTHQVVTRILANSTTTSVTNDDGSGANLQVNVIPNSTTQNIAVLQNGNLVSENVYPALNFIQGAGIGLVITENSGQQRWDVTISSSGGGGGIETINGTPNQITAISSGLGAIVTLSLASPFVVLASNTTAIAIAPQIGYVPMNASTRVVLTLPTTIAAGSVFRVSGFGAAGWQIAQNSGQSIYFGNQNTTLGTGGSLASTNAKDCVEIVCVVADTTFLVVSSVGNITYV